MIVIPRWNWLVPTTATLLAALALTPAPAGAHDAGLLAASRFQTACQQAGGSTEAFQNVQLSDGRNSLLSVAGVEESFWLCPIEDRRGLGSFHEGMIEGFSLGNYLLLVDYSGRLFREGKATISRVVAEILERLGRSADS